MHVPWIEFGASLFAAVICIPLIFRKIPKNMWYGMRTSRTLNGSDENWFETNRVAGLAMTITLLISAAGDIFLGLLPIAAIAKDAAAAVLLIAAVLAPLLLYRKRLF